MTIYTRLFEAKKEIGKISKDSKNPFYKSKYFDINKLLEHVEPILHKNELMVLQPINNGSVITQIVDVDSGEMVTSSIELTDQPDPQKKGSEITYYRRYTLASLLGLQAEDDDANATVKTPSKETTTDDNKKWLNKFESDKKTISRDYKRALATLSTGKDVNYLRDHFKISKSIEKSLEFDSNEPA